MSYEVLSMLILRNSSTITLFSFKKSLNIAKKNARSLSSEVLYCMPCILPLLIWRIEILWKPLTHRTCMVLSTFVLHIIEVLDKIYCFSFENATTNSSLYQCCSGLCIDLLRMLSKDVGFDYELFEVDDEKWGAFDKVRTTEKHNLHWK